MLVSDKIKDKLPIDNLNDYYEKPADPIATHPRLFLNNTTLPKIRENLTNEENLFAYDSVIKNVLITILRIMFLLAVGYIIIYPLLHMIVTSVKDEAAFYDSAKIFLPRQDKSFSQSHRAAS